MPKTILKGKVLSSGQPCSGILRIIRTKKDFKFIKPKEIVYLPRNVIMGDGLLNIYNLVTEGVSGILTDIGGKTDHGSVIASEFGIIRILIASDRETEKKLEPLEGHEICITNDGNILTTKSFLIKKQAIGDFNSIPKIKHKVMVNIGFPQILAKYPQLAEIADGVGLVRLEFVLLGILNGLHPKLFIKKYGKVFFVNKLSEELEKIVFPFDKKDKEVWFCTNDFTPGDLFQFKGGDNEILEKNPALGYRGMSRSLNESQTMLIPEILAIKKLVDKGYRRLGVFTPMSRFFSEYIAWKKLIESLGLRDIKFGLQIETPSVALTFEQFIPYVDFVSFGSNDLTQFTLALDRTDPRLQKYFDESDKAVLKLFEGVINLCRKNNIESNICGQAGSNWKILEKLLDLGLNSTSVFPRPEIVLNIKQKIAYKEKMISKNGTK